MILMQVELEVGQELNSWRLEDQILRCQFKLMNEREIDERGPFRQIFEILHRKGTKEYSDMQKWRYLEG